MVLSLLIERTHRMLAFPFGIVCGLTYGAYYGMASGVYASIVPGGQEAEYTAVGAYVVLFACCWDIAGWLSVRYCC